jgi:hypothetical protein
MRTRRTIRCEFRTDSLTLFQLTINRLTAQRERLEAVRAPGFAYAARTSAADHAVMRLMGELAPSDTRSVEAVVK